jgi:hypothetical protein
METFLQEIRFAARALSRSPYVVLVAVLSIGIGVGSAVASYSWMDGLVLHPFPAAADQTRLVGIEVEAPGGMGAWSYSSFTELERSLHSLSGIAAFRILRASVRQPGEQGSTPLLVTTVSRHYFSVLGIRPAIGRSITDADVASRAQIAMLGYDFWRERYGGRADAIGRSVFLNGERFTIVGVAPPRFAGVYTGVVPHFYVPATTEPLISGVNTLDDRKLRSWLLFGRLAPGVTIAGARSEADAFNRRLSESYGDRPPSGADVMYLRLQFLGKTLSPLFAAMLGVATLLVILASANVAGLLLVRADARRAEIAVRRGFVRQSPAHSSHSRCCCSCSLACSRVDSSAPQRSTSGSPIRSMCYSWTRICARLTPATALDRPWSPTSSLVSARCRVWSTRRSRAWFRLASADDASSR